MQLDGPESKRFTPGAGRVREGRTERERGRARMGAKEEKFKAREVKLEGHTLSAFLLPA